MTIAVTVKVNDGLILAADSASTVIQQDANGNVNVANVYNNANKIFNLRKGLPIGGMTWGSGAIGSASIETLAKDLRRRFSGEDKDHLEWTLDVTSYTMQDVAQRVYDFLYTETYVPAFAEWNPKPVLGFFVAGYSAGGAMAEEFHIDIDAEGKCEGPIASRPQEVCGIEWNGQPEAIHRLVSGYGSELPRVLHENLGVPAEEIEPVMQVLGEALMAPIAIAAMPVQDAIDLARFLVETTADFTKFMPGAPTVGGPTEIVAISKHEGFKWVQRKHYFSAELNPRVDSPADL